MTFKNKKDYLNYLKNKEIKLGKGISWIDYLEKELGRNFEITTPRMPLQDYSKYKEWKIIFERYIPLLKRNCILIGASLGGIFLAKYLSENKFPKKILSTYLVCSPFDNTISTEDLVGGFKLGPDLSLLEKNSKNVYLMFSKDDQVVPVEHAEKYRKKLNNAKIIIYKSKKGHFRIKKFPEIVKLIKEDVKRL
ncbi:MAG: alpha/beta hydrolase [Patescibacteria group bacterium]|nr:alpha/beta hydrolase [Patescibacteria group bacterium]